MSTSSLDRKSVAPKDPSAKPTTLAPQAPDGYSLLGVIALVGRAEREAVEGFVVNLPKNDVIRTGRRASADRVVTDGVRIVGEAADFVRSADASQRTLLPAVTDEFLSAAGTALELAQSRRGAVTRRTGAARRQRRSARATASGEQAKAAALRDVLFDNIATLAAGDATWLERLDGAWGTSETHASTADSVDAMVAVGRDLVREREPKGDAAERVEALFRKAAKLAASVRRVGEAADAVPSRAGVTGGDAHYWTGVALWFVHRLVNLFASANKSDATIPKLSVISLRKVLSRSRRAKKPAKSPPPVTG